MKLVAVDPAVESTAYAYQYANGHRHKIVTGDE
jgi:hypothetical protein